MKIQNKVSILSTGLANVSSVSAAFSRLGFEIRFVEAPLEVTNASYLILPGVGAFGAGMAKLEEYSLSDAIRERIQIDRPTLAICLGMQLLCQSSSESPDIAGLGIINSRVERLNGNEKVPQLGWNKVEPSSNEGLVTEGYAYFANSYCLKTAPAGFLSATTKHGEVFISAVEKNSLLACQFHPELSGSWGQELLRKWSSL